jgi:hypothetical protein
MELSKLIMQLHIEWTEPPAILEHRKLEAKKVVREFWWFTTKWCWSLWPIPSLALYYFRSEIFTPAESKTFLTAFILLGLLFPTGFALLISLLSLFVLGSKAEKYELNSKGVCFGSTGRGGCMSWKRLESYRFDDHPQLPGVRVLEMQSKPIMGSIVSPRQLSFDPSETSELEIQAVIEQFRP